MYTTVAVVLQRAVTVSIHWLCRLYNASCPSLSIVYKIVSAAEGACPAIIRNACACRRHTARTRAVLQQRVVRAGLDDHCVVHVPVCANVLVSLSDTQVKQGARTI